MSGDLQASKEQPSREHPIAPVVRNTLNQIIVPIVVVPGVMGSRLQVGKNKWDPDDTEGAVMKQWILCSASDGRKDMHWKNVSGSCLTTTPHASFSPDQLNRGWATVSKGFYLNLLIGLSLGKPGSNFYCPVWAFGYDWRQDNRISAQKLCDKVRNEILKPAENINKVVIVTHSMGGLVTRWALKELGLEADVMGVVHTVQPAWGAKCFYRRFRQGASIELDGGGEWVADFALKKIMGDTAEKFATLLSALPGPMQLLPNDRNSSWLKYRPGERRRHGLDDISNIVKPIDWTGSIYDAYKEPTGNPGIINHAEYTSPDKVGIKNDLMTHIEDAKKFHQSLQDYKHPTTYSIYGDLKPTDNSIIVNCPVRGTDHYGNTESDFFMPCAPKRTDSGDGTVPAESASGLYPAETSGPKQFRFKADHAKCFADTNFLSQVINCVRVIVGMAPDDSLKGNPSVLP